LPYVEPALAHFNSEVIAFKEAGIDHDLFHVPHGMPVKEIARVWANQQPRPPEFRPRPSAILWAIEAVS
jgi:hypothetical protein